MPRQHQSIRSYNFLGLSNKDKVHLIFVPTPLHIEKYKHCSLRQFVKEEECLKSLFQNDVNVLLMCFAASCVAT